MGDQTAALHLMPVGQRIRAGRPIGVGIRNLRGKGVKI